MWNKMTKEERFDLFIELKRKRIKIKDVANFLGCSSAWLSQFFGEKQVKMSEEHLRQIKEYVASK